MSIEMQEGKIVKTATIKGEEYVNVKSFIVYLNDVKEDQPDRRISINELISNLTHLL